MVRISDARMSGTAYGTVVLHTAPEAAAGGPLALVQTGDMIEVDVAEAQARAESHEGRTRQAPQILEARCPCRMAAISVSTSRMSKAPTRAPISAFLKGKRGAAVPREWH